MKKKKKSKIANVVSRLSRNNKAVVALLVVVATASIGVYTLRRSDASSWYQAVITHPSYQQCQSRGVFTANSNKAAIAVYRPSNSTFYIDTNLDGKADRTIPFGNANTDIPCVGDYNNDKVDDIAVYRPSNSTWYIDTNLDGRSDKSETFGKPGDLPSLNAYMSVKSSSGGLSGFAPRDDSRTPASPQMYRVRGGYGGDIFCKYLALDDIRKEDQVFNPITWANDGNTRCSYILHDGYYQDDTVLLYNSLKKDPSGCDGGYRVQYHKRSSKWNYCTSYNVRFGNPGDKPIYTDFNGDNRDDLGVYRPSNSTFYVDTNNDQRTDITRTFGSPGDVPIAANYSGSPSGAANIAVYRPSNQNFYIDTNGDGVADIVRQFGNPGDIPLANIGSHRTQ